MTDATIALSFDKKKIAKFNYCFQKHLRVVVTNRILDALRQTTDNCFLHF